MNSDQQKRAALLIATMASFTGPFMISSINIALPVIEKEFQLNAILLSWIVNSFLLSTAVFLVPAGRMADLYGRKLLFKWGIILFSISTLLCGLSNNIIQLILFRTLQGMSGAMIMTTGVAILISVFPANERGRVLGINVAAVYTGLSMGPFAGGLLTQHLGWRSVFYTTVPLSLLIVYFTVYRLKGEWADAKGEKFDLTGTLIYAMALIALVYGASVLPSILGVILILTGILLLWIFARWELSHKFPVFEVKLFKGNRVFAFSNLAALINYSATFAITFLLSLYLQNILGLSPQNAGFVLVSQPVIMAIFSPYAGRLSDRVEPRIIASLGMAITAIGLILFIFTNSETSLTYIVMALVLLGFGFALFSSPNMNTIMSSVEKRFYGIASGSAATMRLLGQMMSMAIATLLFALFLGKEPINTSNIPAFITSIKWAFGIFSVLCITGIYFSMARGELHNSKS
ncbi:MAG: MFS transporter [Marinifilaceae bacterium]|jgi:EmrB/QacA subfamily drug resistance transporter